MTIDPRSAAGNHCPADFDLSDERVESLAAPLARAIVKCIRNDERPARLDLATAIKRDERIAARPDKTNALKTGGTAQGAKKGNDDDGERREHPNTASI